MHIAIAGSEFDSSVTYSKAKNIQILKKQENFKRKI